MGHNVAYFTAQAGDPGEARRQYEELLPDMVRVLGLDDGATMTTLHELAY